MAVKHNEAVWSVAEAKAKFSEVIERAIHEGPQEITRNGKDAVVVVSVAEWQQTTGKVVCDSLGLEDGPQETARDFFRRIARPDNEDLVFERLQDPPRHLDL